MFGSKKSDGVYDTDMFKNLGNQNQYRAGEGLKKLVEANGPEYQGLGNFAADNSGMTPMINDPEYLAMALNMLRQGRDRGNEEAMMAPGELDLYTLFRLAQQAGVLNNGSNYTQPYYG